jgi:hypothetical protein
MRLHGSISHKAASSRFPRFQNKEKYHLSVCNSEKQLSLQEFLQENKQETLRPNVEWISS